MNWCWDESFEFHLGIYFSHLLKYLYVFVNVQEEIKIDIFMILFSVKLNISLVITLKPCNSVTKLCHLFTITSLAKHYEECCTNLMCNHG